MKSILLCSLQQNNSYGDYHYRNLEINFNIKDRVGRIFLGYIQYNPYIDHWLDRTLSWSVFSCLPFSVVKMLTCGCLIVEDKSYK